MTGRGNQYWVVWAAVPAIILGVWLMSLSGAPRSAQILQIAVASVAAVLAVVAVRRHRVKQESDAAWLVLGLTASLFIPLVTGSQDGPARWLVLGSSRLYIAPVVLPLAVFLMGAPWRPPAIYAVAVIGAAAALALQPDASQLTAFALAMLVHLASSRSSVLIRATLSAMFMCCAVVAWRTPDPLEPVRYVEGIFSVAADASPFAFIAALIASALPVVGFARVAYIERASGAFAVAVYYATLFALAPLQVTPVPLLGFGAGPIVGYFLVAGAASRVSAREAS